MNIIINNTNNVKNCPIYDTDQHFLSDVLLNLIIAIGDNMSDSTDTNPSPAPSLQKRKKTPWMIIGVVIVIVVALIAVVVLGGFLNSTPTETDMLKKVKANGQLIVGTQVPYKPFEFYNITSQKYEGIDMELAQKIAAALGVTLVIKPMDFDPLFAAVETGQIDMAISSITITATRELTVNFTHSYYLANQAILVKATSTITDINGLNGTKIVAQLGTTGASWAKTNLVNTGRINSADYSDYVDVAAAAVAVQNGQKDAFVVDTPVANAYAADPNNNLKVAFIIETNENYGVCIQRNQTDFRNAINTVIDNMKADGSLQALILKYN